MNNSLATTVYTWELQAFSPLIYNLRLFALENKQGVQLFQPAKKTWKQLKNPENVMLNWIQKLFMCIEAAP